MCHLKGWIKGISAALCVIALTYAAQASSFVWTRGLSPSAGGAGKCVGTDGQGNVYLAGNFAGSLSIGNTNLHSSTNIVNSPAGNSFLACYDVDGNLSWACQTTGQTDQDVNALAVDSMGNVYIAGSFGGYKGRGMAIGGITLTNAASTNMFLAKFDPSGQLQWAKAAATTAAKGLAIDRDGNLYMVGWFNSIAVFDSVSLTNTSGGGAAFLVKYDLNGNLQWAKNLGGRAEANAVAVDGQGNPIVVGMYQSQSLAGAQLPFFGGFQAAFVAKFDPQGNVQWIQGAGGSGNDIATGIGVDQGNNVYVSGTFEHSFVFGDQVCLDYADQFPVEGGVGGKPGDTFLAKYSVDGKNLWARQFATLDVDVCYGLGVDAAGNCHLTGGVTNSVFFGDYDANGLFTGVQAVGNRTNNAANVGRGVVSDRFGNVYVTGVLGATNQVFGSDTLTNAGIFLTKLAVFNPTNPPVISTQISNQTAIVTSNCFFSVGVTSDSPLNYQWQFNGVDIPQATNSLLQLSNLTFAASGIYNVIISNSHGAVTSSFANLTVDFPQEFIWARRAGGANFDEARAVTVDTNGNSYVTGVFQSVADFGSQKLTNYNASTSAFNWDIFIAKYNPAGNLLWVRQAGGTNTDEPRAIEVDREGSVYIAGVYTGVARFDGIVLTNTPFYSSAFFAKYSSDGDVQWAQRLPPFSANPFNLAQPYGIGVDSTNGIYLAGGVSGYVQIGTNIVPQGFFLAKANSDGNFEWVQTGSSTNASSPVVCNGQGVAIDSEDRIFVTGYFFRAAMRFGTNFLDLRLGEPSGGQRGFVARYDTAGNVLWVQKVFVTDSQATAVAADGLGNVFVTGRYAAFTDGSVDFAGQQMPEVSSTNLFLVKYDAMGTPLWGRGVGGTNYYDYCAGTSVATDGLGGVYVAGTNGSPFPPSVRSQTKFNPTTLVDAGGFVAKYGTAGNFLWARSAGTYAKSVSTMGTNAWVVGSFTETRNFGITNFFNGGSSDIYIAKLGINEPKLITQPTNQLVILGSNATLRVTTSGTGPLSYQWFLNGVAISGATSSTLTLTNVQGANAGSYSVAVSNPAGTVNSTIGVVNVVPVADVPRVDGTNLVIGWAAGFTLQISTNGVAGPYYDVPSATSPFTNSIEAPEQYFRLRN